MKALLPLALLAIAALLVGCGGGTVNCTPTAVVVTPQAGSADHAGVAPNNQVQFFAGAKVPSGCVTTAALLQPTWTTSDPVNTSISSLALTNGIATCINATPQPVTITATSGNLSGTATLSCR